MRASSARRFARSAGSSSMTITPSKKSSTALRSAARSLSAPGYWRSANIGSPLRRAGRAERREKLECAGVLALGEHRLDLARDGQDLFPQDLLGRVGEQRDVDRRDGPVARLAPGVGDAVGGGGRG